mgnify:CR=1 FL=1
MNRMIMDNQKLKEEKYELQNRLEREVQQNIAKEVLRFHVIANSDTKEDQKLKMQVTCEPVFERKKLY